MTFSPVFTVIRREYLVRVKTRGFILSTIGIPLILMLMLVVPAYFGSRNAEARSTLIVMDETGVLADQLATRLEEADFNLGGDGLKNLPMDSLEALVESGDLGGVLVLDESTLQEGRAVYKARDGLSTLRSFALRRVVMEAVLENRLRSASPDLDVAALLGGGELEMDLIGLKDQDESARDAARVTALVGVFLLYFIFLIYGQYVMRAVLEEKRDRIVEVIISSIRPSELMLGKILGVGGVVLTQLFIWVLSGVFLVTMALPAMMTALPGLENVQEVVDIIPAARSAILLFIFFPLGFFLYAALYAAAGALCNSDDDVQQAQLPVTLLIVAAFFLVFMTIDGPTRGWTVALSMFPLFSPIMMFSSAAQGLAPMWQVVGSVLLLMASVPAVAWFAGRIYRVGILMQGKRPTLPEIIRWVRQS